MKTSKKQKGKIYEATRKALSAQHKDSIEYGIKVFYPYTDEFKEMSALERNAHALMDGIDQIEDYAIHNIMAKLRHEFRELRRETLSTMAVNRYGKVHISHLTSLYDSMMGLTKQYLPKFCSCCGYPFGDDICDCALQACDDCGEEQAKLQEQRYEELEQIEQEG